MSIFHSEIFLQQTMSKSQKYAPSSNVSTKGRKRKGVSSSTQNVTKKSKLTKSQ